MPVMINWVDDLSEEKESSCFKISALIGELIVHRVEQVVTKTEWCIYSSEIRSSKNDRQCSQIQHFLDNPKGSLVINLKKQGTGFRNKVWSEICKIPVGRVLSYSELAKKIDSGPRAVANACRDNIYPGIIPCHRVVAKSGLGGFMGQTNGKPLEIKRKLLQMEMQ